jgi:hypothetical protein
MKREKELTQPRAVHAPLLARRPARRWMTGCAPDEEEKSSRVGSAFASAWKRNWWPRGGGQVRSATLDNVMEPSCRSRMQACGVAARAGARERLQAQRSLNQIPERSRRRRRRPISRDRYSDRDLTQSRCPGPLSVMALMRPASEGAAQTMGSADGRSRRVLPERSGASLRALLREGMTRTDPRTRLRARPSGDRRLQTRARSPAPGSPCRGRSACRPGRAA